ncbi:MAG: right-handed parallel beta-helix repeat-containing protein [Planctomycetes bacterium]|nr:right-handed parallel beta-helix repeat-containing protein [Planctomycetota bacterium]
MARQQDTNSGGWEPRVGTIAMLLATGYLASCSGGGPTTGGVDGNERPIADAGPGRGVSVNELLSLDGSTSRDPDGGKLTYSWTIASKPAGSNATLSGHETAWPTIVPDVLGSYSIELVVNDGDDDSTPDTTIVVADHGANHRVGPGRTYETPSAVAAIAKDGDIITIDATEYIDDVAVWRANGLVLHGIGGRAHIVGRGASAQGKALWVVQGANTRIENIEFSGATVKDQNGAGIRGEGAGLTLRGCSFHDNENGVLVANNAASNVVVENCHFEHNGFGDGQTHNMYVNRVKSLTVLYSTFERAKIGHQLKSRAERTLVLYSRLLDTDDGNASYSIDLPNGGIGIVIGNQIHQGPNAPNDNMIAFAGEGAVYSTNELYLVHNTMVNDKPSGTFVRVWPGATVRLINNLLVGPGAVSYGAGSSTGDVRTTTPAFVDRSGYDFRSTANTPGRDSADDPGLGAGFDLEPKFELDKVAGLRPRPSVGRLDAGAFEFVQ